MSKKVLIKSINYLFIINYVGGYYYAILQFYT